jgi:hypothetical protein
MPPSSCRPPEYGSPEWRALDKDDPQRREAVLFAADCWRLLTSSPHVSELLGEWTEWMHRKTARESSWAISAAVDWRAVADTSPYAELARRRSRPAWSVPCLARGIGGCKTIRTLDRKPTVEDLVCDSCRASSMPVRDAA